MPKPRKPKATTAQSRSFYALHPWECQHYEDRVEIVAYVEASGAWETILIVNHTAGISAESMAAYVAGIINQHHCKKDALHDAMEALELVMNDGLNFSSEQAIEHALLNIKKLG
jgi:hypothetical protein